jgi:hypothetical protein
MTTTTAKTRPTTSRPDPSTTKPKTTNQQKEKTMNLNRGVQLINEALSRARTRRPQSSHSEATRPARQIMMSSRRREQDRLLGL